MSTEDQYASCSVCGHAFRPGSVESVDGHRVATGHAPAPSPEPPDLQHLLLVAARRIGELEDVVAGLDKLATTWERVTGDHVRATAFRDAARMLRGYLARPPIHALDEEEPDG